MTSQVDLLDDEFLHLLVSRCEEELDTLAVEVAVGVVVVLDVWSSTSGGGVVVVHWSGRSQLVSHTSNDCWLLPSPVYLIYILFHCER